MYIKKKQGVASLGGTRQGAASLEKGEVKRG